MIPAAPDDHSMEKQMSPAAPRLPYSAPRLQVFGTVRELTLTVTVSQHKNDSTQGQNNLKT